MPCFCKSGFGSTVPWYGISQARSLRKVEAQPFRSIISVVWVLYRALRLGRGRRGQLVGSPRAGIFHSSEKMV